MQETGLIEFWTAHEVEPDEAENMKNCAQAFKRHGNIGDRLEPSRSRSRPGILVSSSFSESKNVAWLSITPNNRNSR